MGDDTVLVLALDTIGMLLILSAREEQKRKLGSKFDPAKFHRQLLGYGTSPTPLIAERFARNIEPGEGRLTA